jgi:hypothetical protein
MAQIGSVKLKHGVEWLILWLVLPHSHRCSEFPDRECCDPVFPFEMTDPEPLPPLPTTTISSAAGNGLQHGGSQTLPGRSGECALRLGVRKKKIENTRNSPVS